MKFTCQLPLANVSKASTLLLLLLATGCGANPQALKHSQNGTGKRDTRSMDGGDPLSMKFTAARFRVVDALRKMDVTKIQESDFQVGRSAREWIVNNQFALAEDIDGSPHQWSKEPEAECAATTATAKASISFSAPVCRETARHKLDMMRLLVHESAHHLGITDDTLADAIALTVLPYGLEPRDHAEKTSNSVDANTPQDADTEDSNMETLPGTYQDDGNTSIITGIHPVESHSGQSPSGDSGGSDVAHGGPNTNPDSSSKTGWYTAIAFDQESGKIGYSWRQQNQLQAEKTALSACQKDGCRILVAAQDTCLSLARPQGHGTAFWANSPDRAEAGRASTRNCQQFNRIECSSITVCSSGF